MLLVLLGFSISLFACPCLDVVCCSGLSLSKQTDSAVILFITFALASLSSFAVSPVYLGITVGRSALLCWQVSSLVLAGHVSSVSWSALLCWQVSSLVLVVSSLVLAGKLSGVGRSALWCW